MRLMQFVINISQKCMSSADVWKYRDSVLGHEVYFTSEKYCFQVLQYFSPKSIAVPHAILNLQPVLQYLLQY